MVAHDDPRSAWYERLADVFVYPDAGYVTRVERAAESLRPRHPGAAARLEAAIGDLRAATAHVVRLSREGRKAEQLGGATAYLRLFGMVFGAALLARALLGQRGTGRNGRMVAIALYFTECLLGETTGLRRIVEAGAAGLEAQALAALSVSPATN